MSKSTLWCLAVSLWFCETLVTPFPRAVMADDPMPVVKGPLSPEESLKHFVLADPNLQIEIVAAEPEVIDPVAIQFDEHGRLWVVELSDYPNGPEPGKPPLSRIKLLEDKDGDGRYETAHIFADKLLFATGVQPWDGGVIVTLAGEVAYFKDTDGDHKADVRETWFTGFAQANPQLRANHPTFGPDGWIYVANGLRGGNVIAVKKDWPSRLGLRPDPSGKAQVGTESQPTEPQPVSLTGRDFKFDPLTGRYEAISGNGQFGMTFDAWGNRFVCDNRHPCRHVIFEEDFIKRCPHVAFPAVVHDVIPADDKNQVFPLSSAWTTSNLHAGTFTAACGVTVYTGDWLPEEFRGNVFVCEPTGNLVQRAILEPDGVTFKSRNPYARRAGDVSPPSQMNDKPDAQNGKDKTLGGLTPSARQDTQEFLASRDDWFRPVDLQNGPDGALYVVDMYRAVIEHPEWVPDELKKRPDTWLGNDKGRIYRIRPKGERPKLDLAVLGTKEGYRHRNFWKSMTSLRMLIQRRELYGATDFYAVLPNLQYDLISMRKMINAFSQNPTFSTEREYWDHGREYRRSHWLRDTNSQVRHLGLQFWSLVLPVGAVAECEDIASVAFADADDPWMRQTAVAVAGDSSAVVLGEVFHLAQSKPRWGEPGFRELVSRFCEQIGFRGSESDVNWVIAKLGEIARSDTDGTDYSRKEFAISGFVSLGSGLARKGQSLANKKGFSDLARHSLQLIERDCCKMVVDEKCPLNVRQLAIRWLRYGGHDSHPAWITNYLRQFAEKTSDQSLKVLVIETLSLTAIEENDPWFVKRYPVETPAIRRAILAALFASKERQLRLLEAIEQGQIAATELDPVRVNQLTQAKDETLRERAKTVLAAAAPASRHEVHDAYRPALALTADPKRGREVFVKNCSTCHRVDNVGVNVAPDISDTRTKKPEQLLLDILDPNKAIDANYFAYAVSLKDGTVQSGVITTETASSITLKQPEGKVLTLLRTDIEELRNTGLSLMPVGLEKNVNEQAMADLIFWLKNWRYLDGKVPATSLK